MPVLLQQVPPRRPKFASRDLTALIDPLGSSLVAILDRHPPGDVAIALDHGMRAAPFVCFVGVKRGVNPAVDDPRSTLARLEAKVVTDERITGMDADADNITRLERVWIERLENFVGQDRIAPLGWGRRREDIEPARGDESGPEGKVTRVDDVYPHDCLS